MTSKSRQLLQGPCPGFDCGSRFISEFGFSSKWIFRISQSFGMSSKWIFRISQSRFLRRSLCNQFTHHLAPIDNQTSPLTKIPLLGQIMDSSATSSSSCGCYLKSHLIKIFWSFICHHLSESLTYVFKESSTQWELPIKALSNLVKEEKILLKILLKEEKNLIEIYCYWHKQSRYWVCRLETKVGDILFDKNNQNHKLMHVFSNTQVSCHLTRP